MPPYLPKRGDFSGTAREVPVLDRVGEVLPAGFTLDRTVDVHSRFRAALVKCRDFCGDTSLRFRRSIIYGAF